MMKSPFPGMDPYIEGRWSDVHISLVTAIREHLQPLLPSGLRARAEERIVLETNAGDEPVTYRADVALVERPYPTEDFSSGHSSATTLESVTVEFMEAPRAERWLQIMDVTNGNRVVTAIEILSAWNKAAGRGNDDYRRKVDNYQKAAINVVEIDLLRHPSRNYLVVTPESLPPDMRSPYVVCASHARRPWKWTAYPLRLRKALPSIPIPLRPSDAPISLNLQEVIERVYAGGGHDDIDYKRPLDPPLSPEDEAWADGLLRESGRR